MCRQCSLFCRKRSLFCRYSNRSRRLLRKEDRLSSHRSRKFFRLFLLCSCLCRLCSLFRRKRSSCCRCFRRSRKLRPRQESRFRTAARSGGFRCRSLRLHSPNCLNRAADIRRGSRRCSSIPVFRRDGCCCIQVRRGSRCYSVLFLCRKALFRLDTVFRLYYF